MSSIETIIDDAANIATIDSRGRMRSSYKKRERERERERERASIAIQDWKSIWSHGTDAVMDVPLGGVCEVLYGDGGDDEDLKDQDEVA